MLYILNIYNFINKYVNKKIKGLSKNTTEGINTKVTIRMVSPGALDNKGGLDLIPGPGRSPGEGNGYPHLYSCLYLACILAWRIPWWATVHGS